MTIASTFAASPLPRLLYRLQSGYLRLARPLTLGVRVVVRDATGAVLLVRHTYRPGWFLPGGGVRKWESFEAAAVRECREEASIEVERLSPPFGLYAHFTAERCDHVALYLAERWRPGRGGSLEIAETGFFAPDRLPAETAPATRRRLDEVLGRAPRGGVW